MAPNKRGAPPKAASDVADGGVISKAEVEARGAGTAEDRDTYDFTKPWASEKRVFFTGNTHLNTSSVLSCAALSTPPAITQPPPPSFPATFLHSTHAGLMFFTRLPCPGWCDHHPAYLMRSLQWAPAIGTIVGVWAAVWLTAAAVLWPPKVAVAASTLATVWLTGCFHEDGLADCFDGFGGGWGRAQILRIMKDSRVGTYALVGMSLVLAMKLHCLEVLELRDSAGSYTAAGALIAAHTLSR